MFKFRPDVISYRFVFIVNWKTYLSCSFFVMFYVTWYSVYVLCTFFTLFVLFTILITFCFPSLYVWNCCCLLNVSAFYMFVICVLLLLLAFLKACSSFPVLVPYNIKKPRKCFYPLHAHVWFLYINCPITEKYSDMLTKIFPYSAWNVYFVMNFIIVWYEKYLPALPYLSVLDYTNFVEDARTTDYTLVVATFITNDFNHFHHFGNLYLCEYDIFFESSLSFLPQEWDFCIYSIICMYVYQMYWLRNFILLLCCPFLFCTFFSVSYLSILPSLHLYRWARVGAHIHTAATIGMWVGA